MNEWMNEYMTCATRVELSKLYDVFRAFLAHFCAIKKTRDLRTNRRTDVRTDRQTDGWTDGPTDGLTYSLIEMLRRIYKVIDPWDGHQTNRRQCYIAIISLELVEKKYSFKSTWNEILPLTYNQFFLHRNTEPRNLLTKKTKRFVHQVCKIDQ